MTNVCVLLQNNKGQILSVSRKNDRTAWGLPGGKIEPGESPEEAAKRELKEETHFWGDPLDIVFADFEAGELTITYRLDDGLHFFSQQKLHQPKGEGTVAWKEPIDLINGPFGEYNKKLFDTVGIWY